MPVSISVWGMILFLCKTSIGFVYADMHEGDDFWDRVAVEMQRGAYSEAIRELEHAEADQPENHHIHRILGVCWLREGNHAKAEASLREALRLHPDSIASRYDLAQVLALRGKMNEAEFLLTEVMDLAPESLYAARAAEILPGLRQLRQTLLVQDQPKRWSLYARIAGEWDDNVPARPASSPDGDTEAFRVTSSVYAAYRLTDQRSQPGLPTLETGIRYYRSDYPDDDFGNFEVESISASLDLSRNGRLFGKWMEVGLMASYTDTQLGGDAFNTDVGGAFRFSLQPAPRVMTTARFSAHRKSFDSEPEFPEFFSREGEEYEGSFDTHFYLFENRMILGAGYAYMWNDVDGSQFQLNRHRFRGSMTLNLPLALRWYTQVSFSSEDYESFVPDPKRQDDVWTAYTSLSRALGSPAWRAEVNATHTQADSSRDFAEYERTVYGIAISWSP
ncbi:MAG: tetratricopeptide repeat protein [Verrucomicrobia bacterium]|nr:tetratricopeptide repeat protein [Verrucomicrobiota bacterium]MCH8510858.1 tetratricopeptide repeat protein [Kiritimatiellia bacterium]